MLTTMGRQNTFIGYERTCELQEKNRNRGRRQYSFSFSIDTLYCNRTIAFTSYCIGTSISVFVFFLYKSVMPLKTLSQTRKEQRKFKRQKRKRQPPAGRIEEHENDRNDAAASKVETTKAKKRKKDDGNKNEKSSVENFVKKGPYANLDPNVVDSIRKDDEEIAALGAKLGIGKGKGKKEKLNKEYARLEGYGEDFGDFLDDLDGIVQRISGDPGHVDDPCPVDDQVEDQDSNDGESSHDDDDRPPYSPNVAAAIERDDAEIADLERKLTNGKKKDKSKLYKEYKLEGYGDDFGDFLDGLDDMMSRVKNQDSSEEYKERLTRRVYNDDEEAPQDDGESSEELVPLKAPAYEDMDEDDSVLEELEREEKEESRDSTEEEEIIEDSAAHSNFPSDDDSAMNDDGGSEDEEESIVEEPDHDVSDTYRPSEGEDIYGNRVDSADGSGNKPSKYVPPHLRNKTGGDKDTSVDAEKYQAIRRGLNNALNRLSDDTLVSVAQQLAQLYSQYPTQMVHELLWKNAKDASVLVPILMKGMIPAYIACIIGAHIQSNDTVQIGEYILEAVVSELWLELDKFRGRGNDDGTHEELSLPSEIVSKHICNRMLILCYLYNFNIVHCSFMYDVIRHLIKNFSEVDIECLLLLLSHCGRSLRSADPLALKEIVLLVQKKNAEVRSKENSSRAEFMVTAITDLKNNKRGKQDTAHGERTTKLKKILGQIKSAAAKLNTAKTSVEATLRISLKDILNAEIEGRWWKVGASWVGNQYRFEEGSNTNEESVANSTDKNKTAQSKQDEALLKLATKLRMNTDRKRSIFCIIMGSEDCEDAFEKLCRGSMLQNKSERDTCRVLLECCLNEKIYNKFYGHLAARMCEFQPQCKFSLQLAFWDIFKQFDSMDVRKAANLAKFLFEVSITHQLLRVMTVLKAVDISEDDMEEPALIFMTIFLSSILDHFNDTSPIKAIFTARHSEHAEDETRQEQEEGARASLLVFFMEVLKASPKNVSGSQFKKNFKAAVKALDTDGFEYML